MTRHNVQYEYYRKSRRNRYVYYNNIIMLCINIMPRWRVAVSIGTQSEYSSLNVTILLYVSLASRFRAHNM